MDGLVRIKEVCQVTGLSNSTIWKWVKEDKFPKPIKLSYKVTVWKASEVKAFIDALGVQDAE